MPLMPVAEDMLCDIFHDFWRKYLVITCWERADLLALLCVIFSCPIWCPGSGVVLDCINS